jgi:hypothetical protein
MAIALPNSRKILLGLCTILVVYHRRGILNLDSGCCAIHDLNQALIIAMQQAYAHEMVPTPFFYIRNAQVDTALL